MEKSKQVGEFDVGVDSNPPKKEEKMESEVEKINFENVSECKKIRSLIQNVVIRNTNINYQNLYDNVRMEYGKTVEASIITKVIDVILVEVWDVYKSDKITYPKIYI